jgi:glycosyltransferase involved in cell wall biosynthesis
VHVDTADRDLGDKGPYPNTTTDEWLESGSNNRVMYCSPRCLRPGNFARLLTSVSADFVYINSMFSRRFAILPLLLHRLGRIGGRVVLAPRGTLQPSCLRFKSARKTLFLKLLKRLGIARRVHFHATDERERREILDVFGATTRITVASNFTEPPGPWLPTSKPPGHMRGVLLGRMHPVKNIAWLLDALRQVRAPVSLDLFGPIEQPAYWHGCLRRMESLPAHVQVRYCGEIRQDQVRSTLDRYDFFLLPTTGENFCHSVYEALSFGKPVLISDQTPWRDLEARQAGWDVPLDDPARYVEVIERCAAMKQTEYEVWSQGAWTCASRYCSDPGRRQAYRSMFCLDGC